MTPRDALDRTLLLVRDQVGPDLGDEVLLDALTGTTVALVADARNLASHAAQTAYVTAAMLMARSGHRVFLVAPDVPLLGPQPPIPPGPMITGLALVGRNMLPGIEFSVGAPMAEVDLLVALGDAQSAVPARRRVRVNAEPWAGMIELWDSPRLWDAAWWPLGALAAAALAAGEAFKAAMLKLLPHAINPAMTAAVFAPTDKVTYRLGPPETPYATDLGEVDFISGGAINSSALYAISRLPAARLSGRVIEPDTYAISNLNRYPLMLASHDGLEKAPTLADTLLGGGIMVKGVIDRYDLGSSVEPLAPCVVVGTDDIPARWDVQRSGPAWLAVGATTHWSAMASFHEGELGCAQCLHPDDDPGGGPIPTQACVSFWAGLLVVAYLCRHAVGQPTPVAEQHVFLTPFRPESAYSGAVTVRLDCPTCAGSRASSEKKRTV